jgi:hypothetical protein
MQKYNLKARLQIDSDADVMFKRIVRMTTVLCLVCLAGCMIPSSRSPDVAELPQAVFFALKMNDVTAVMRRTMTMAHYMTWPRRTHEFKTEDEHRAAVQDAAQRAAETMKDSFASIRKLCADNGFDWRTSSLKQADMDTAKMDFSRVPYDKDDPRVRLDAYLTIKSGPLEAVIQLDDCFKVGDNRFIGDGLRLVRVIDSKDND